MDPKHGRVRILQKPKPIPREETTLSSPAKVAAALFGTTTPDGYYRYDPKGRPITATAGTVNELDTLEAEGSAIVKGQRSSDLKVAAGNLQQKASELAKATEQDLRPVEFLEVQKSQNRVEISNRGTAPRSELHRGRGWGRGRPHGRGYGRGGQGHSVQVHGRRHPRESIQGRDSGRVVWNVPSPQEVSISPGPQQNHSSRQGRTVVKVKESPEEIISLAEFAPHRIGFNKIVAWLDILDLTSTECAPDYPADSLSAIPLRSRSPSPTRPLQKGQPSTAARRRHIEEILRSQVFDPEGGEVGVMKSMETVYEEAKLKMNAPPDLNPW